MSRFSDGDGDYDAGSQCLFRQARHELNLRRTLNGKKGQKILRELEAALLAMPEKRLVEGYLTTPDGDCCTVGLYCAAKEAQAKGCDIRTAAKEMAEGLFEEGWEYDEGYESEENEWDITEAGVAAGLTKTLAWELGWRNDVLLGGSTPEGRYARVLGWVQKKILPEAEARQEVTVGP